MAGMLKKETIDRELIASLQNAGAGIRCGQVELDFVEVNSTFCCSPTAFLDLVFFGPKAPLSSMTPADTMQEELQTTTTKQTSE